MKERVVRFHELLPLTRALKNFSFVKERRKKEDERTSREKKEELKLEREETREREERREKPLRLIGFGFGFVCIHICKWKKLYRRVKKKEK